MLFSPVYIESHPRRSPNSFLGLTPTCPKQTRGISHSPSPVLLPTDHRPLTCPDPVGVPFHHCFKSFSCNIYGSPRKCCKQKTYVITKHFRYNTTKKHRGGMGIRVNQEFDDDPCPARLSFLGTLPGG